MEYSKADILNWHKFDICVLKAPEMGLNWHFMVKYPSNHTILPLIQQNMKSGNINFHINFQLPLE